MNLRNRIIGDLLSRTLFQSLKISTFRNEYPFSINSKVQLSQQMKIFNEKQRYQDALDLFDKNSQYVSDQSINQALKACSKLKNYAIGTKIHQKLSLNSSKNRFILSSLLYFYMQCEDYVNAEKLFFTIKNPTIEMYAVMIKGYVTNRMADKAIKLYQTIKIEPNDIILMGVFNACAQLGNNDALRIGTQLYSIMKKNDGYNVNVLTSAMDMFIKCGEINSAETVFNRIPSKTVIKYGAMMKGFNINSEPLKTLDLFEKMKKESIQANEIIFLLLIDACSQIGIISRCKTIVKSIPSSILTSSKIQTALIDMWGKCGFIHQAIDIFQQISHPDIVTYTAMIHSYGLNGMGSEAVQLFHQIPHGAANEFTYLVTLNACSHSGLLDMARSIFQTIPEKTEKICTAMIDCLSRMFLFDEAENLLEEFEKLRPPYMPMYMAILSGARNQGNSDLAQRIFDKIQLKFSDQHVGIVTTASVLLANTFATSGDIKKSSKIKGIIYEPNIKKMCGISWTEVNGELVEFRAHDRRNPRSSEIYEELNRLSNELINAGHQFDASWITRTIANDESITSVLCGHSEKLALAYNLIQESIPSPIQITKNLRVCGDCHRFLKLLAKIRQLKIIVRDANRFHHFDTTGCCSCQDHF